MARVEIKISTSKCLYSFIQYRSKRSIELSPVSAYYDTLAHLLYRLDFYAEAESMQKKAIELGKAEKRDVKGLQDELEKIQKKTL